VTQQLDQAMQTRLDHAQANYTPVLYKTFAGALEAFLAAECPQLVLLC
jgi:hypothetical protein